MANRKQPVREQMTGKQERPAHIPAENVYTRLHWLIVLALIGAVFSLALVLSLNS